MWRQRPGEVAKLDGLSADTNKNNCYLSHFYFIPSRMKLGSNSTMVTIYELKYYQVGDHNSSRCKALTFNSIGPDLNPSH